MNLYCTHPSTEYSFQRTEICRLCGVTWCKDEKPPKVVIATSHLAKIRPKIV